jgi:hypothetical protein
MILVINILFENPIEMERPIAERFELLIKELDQNGKGHVARRLSEHEEHLARRSLHTVNTYNVKPSRRVS